MTESRSNPSIESAVQHPKHMAICLAKVLYDTFLSVNNSLISSNTSQSKQHFRAFKANPPEESNYGVLIRCLREFRLWSSRVNSSGHLTDSFTQFTEFYSWGRSPFNELMIDSTWCTNFIRSNVHNEESGSPIYNLLPFICQEIDNDFSDQM